MAITLTITDTSVTQTYGLLMAPIVSTPIITETDVQTRDGNISTYYNSTKQSFTVQLGDMTQDEYSVLKGFIARQYQNLKYPAITITGAINLNVNNMVAKMTLNDQTVVTNCGLVEGVQLTFRESKQL